MREFRTLINLDPDEIDEGCLHYSRAMVGARGVDTRAGPYAHGARIPAEPWLPVCDAAWTQDLSARPRVGVMKLRDEVMAPLLAMANTGMLGCDGPVRARALSVLRSELLKRLGYVGGEVAVHGVTGHPPGLETVTLRDPRGGRFLGLHLDSWDGVTLEQRLAARTRVCVNLGPDTRHFLWIPVTISELAQATSLAADAPVSAADCLNACARAPVFRLSLRPGDAYIADTDALLHDGSSSNARVETFHYTLRFHF